MLSLILSNNAVLSKHFTYQLLALYFLFHVYPIRLFIDNSYPVIYYVHT